MRLWLVLTAVVAMLLFAGCGNDDENGGGRTQRPTKVETDEPTVAPDTPTRRPIGTKTRLPTAACSVQGDLEGQFIFSSQMPSYLDCIIPGVEQWIDAAYKSMPHPTAYFFVPVGVAGEDTAGCPYSDKALQYCTEAQSVYLGESAVWNQYSVFGDAAPATIIAHEVRHHFQKIVRVPRATSPDEQIPYEDQADCGAGVFMAYAEQQGWMNRQDDIKDLAGSLQDAGEAEGEERSHGTILERLQSFDSGFLGGTGLYACIKFVPGVPIITGAPTPLQR